MSNSNKCCVLDKTPFFCHELTKFIAQAVTNVLSPEWEKAIQEERKNEEPLHPYEKEWLYSLNYAMIDGFVEDVCSKDQEKIQAIADFTVKYDTTFIHKLAFACVNKCKVVVDSVTREKFEANKYSKLPIRSNDEKSELREFVSSYSNEDPVSFEEFKIQRVNHSNFSVSSKYSSLGVHLKSTGTNEMIHQEEGGDIITTVFAVASPVAEVFTGEQDTLAIEGAVGLSTAQGTAEGRTDNLAEVTIGAGGPMQMALVGGGLGVRGIQPQQDIGGTWDLYGAGAVTA